MGEIDAICVNEVGGLVIVRIKTSIDGNKDNSFCKEFEAKQLEFLALLFDTIAAIIGEDIGIAETGILYWDKEEDNTPTSKGSSKFCRFKRNPDILKCTEDPNRDIYRAMKVFK